MHVYHPIGSAGTHSGPAKILEAKQKKKSERERRIEERRLKGQLPAPGLADENELKLLLDHEEESSEQSIDEDDSDSGIDSTFEHLTPRETSPVAILPQHDLIDQTAMVADRFRLSIRQHLAITTSTVKAAGGNINNFSLSVSTTHRRRRNRRQQAAKEIFDNWIRPQFVICHWDSKLFERCIGIKEDRIAIYVSSPSKLLGIPTIAKSTGIEQQKAVMGALDKWNLTESVVGTVFDTTASNTGLRQGAAALIEQRIGHAILWLPCRHHIAELHIKHTAIAITGETKSPSVKLFARFKEDWESLNVEECEPKRFDWPTDSNSLLYRQAELVKKWAGECLQKDTFPREDYRELCELIAVYLGARIPRGFIFRRPGADHHARFMSKAIYFLKIALLSSSFTLYGQESEDVNRMAIYIGLFYGYYFLRSPLTASAPANDLQFLYWMQELKSIDKPAAEANIQSINRHLDYLTEELVVLALFDSHTSEEEKKGWLTNLWLRLVPHNSALVNQNYPR